MEKCASSGEPLPNANAQRRELSPDAPTKTANIDLFLEFFLAPSPHFSELWPKTQRGLWIVVSIVLLVGPLAAMAGLFVAPFRVPIDVFGSKVIAIIGLLCPFFMAAFWLSRPQRELRTLVRETSRIVALFLLFFCDWVHRLHRDVLNDVERRCGEISIRSAVCYAGHTLWMQSHSAFEATAIVAELTGHLLHNLVSGPVCVIARSLPDGGAAVAGRCRLLA